MGDSPSSLTDPRDPTGPPFEPFYVPPLPPSPPPAPREWRVFFVMLGLTFVSMTLAHAVAPFPLWSPSVIFSAIWQYAEWANGLIYASTCLAILGAHEFGHYLAARYYRVDTSVPYFLPMPILFTGTMGAFIRIRQPIFRKRELFDIGIAGPIAGFLVAVPVVFIGVYLSRIAARVDVQTSMEFGDPLLIKFAAWLTHGSMGEDEIILGHPLLIAGWFGLIVTSINLFPFGQLDGGHISYAVLGRRSATVSRLTVVVMVLLVAFVSWSWLLWAALMIVMLYILGPKHPAVIDEDVPLDRGRIWLAVFAVVMFILCFTPTPLVT